MSLIELILNELVNYYKGKKSAKKKYGINFI